MSHQPPVPEQNQSPYPIAEPPHQPHDHAELRPGEDEEDSDLSIADRAGALFDDMPNLRGRTVIAVGAAIALGVAATVGALLFAQRKPTASPRRSRRPAAATAPRKAAQSRSKKTTAKT